MANKFSNTASVAVLDANITAAATSVVVTNFSGFPTAPFWAEIGRDTPSAEVVKVTGVTGSTLTIARGQDGTLASAHNIGDKLEHVIPAYTANLAETHPEDTIAHGTTSDVVGVDDTGTLTNKTYRGAHTHVFSDVNPVAPGAGYSVTADTVALRDGYAHEASGADVNRRAFVLTVAGVPRFEVFNDGTVRLAPSVAAVRDALEIVGDVAVTNLAVSGAVTGPLAVAGALSADTLSTTGLASLGLLSVAGVAVKPQTMPDVQVFDITGTWNKPAGALFCVVEAQGAAGGGGAVVSALTGQAGAAGGGQGGQYCRSVLAASSLAAAVAVTVGAGGLGGEPGEPVKNGLAGGSSSFGTHVVADGGAGGEEGAVTSGHGTGGGGDIAQVGTGQWKVHGDSGGNGLRDNGRISERGFGGGSHWGGIRRPGLTTTASNGLPGRAYGGGGSGAHIEGPDTLRNGGDGANGRVIVTTFFAG